MLDQLKEENPDLASRALLAAETLKSGMDSEDYEEELEDEVEEELEEEVEEVEEVEEEVEEVEEQIDDRYVLVTAEHTKTFFELRNAMDEKVKEYGIYMRDHEVKKNIALEDIESARLQSENFFASLKQSYPLDENSDYSLAIDSDNSGNLVFVKQ